MQIELTENQILNQICDYLATLRSVYFYRTNNTPIFDATKKMFRKMPKYAVKGIPDIHVIRAGHYIGIEVKRKGKYLSPDQRIFQKNVEAAGGTYILARSFEDVKKALGLG